MRRLFAYVIDHRKRTIATFVVLSVLLAACIPFVRVNPSLSDYLPSTSRSTISLDKMGEIYGDDLANIRVYVQGISESDAGELADSLSDTEHVSNLNWLGSKLDLMTPLDLQDQDTVESWYVDGGYLYTAHVETGHEKGVPEELRALAEATPGATRVAIDGSAADKAYSFASTATDLSKIMIVAVIVVYLIMMFITISYVEPLVMLISIGIAIVMNMGTNIIQGEISSITQLVAAVLQLGVSMDYAIVLTTTYHRIRDNYETPRDAMLEAMVSSFNVILSSAAVTFFGFATLCVMSYRIGMDLGIALAKGIVFSLLSITLLMPCIILSWDRALTRTQHRSFVPSFSKWAGLCRKAAIPAFIVVAVVAVPAYLGKTSSEFSYSSSGAIRPETQLGQDSAFLRETLGEEQTWAILVPSEQWANEDALIADLKALATTESVMSYGTIASDQIPYQLGNESDVSQLMADGYSRIVLTSDVTEESDEAFALVDTVRSICQQHYGDSYYLAGNTVTYADLATVSASDEVLVQLASVAAIGIVLLIMFRSIAIPIILLLAIEISIWINLSVPYFTNTATSFIGYLVIDAVQLAAAVDYSIIYTHEYLSQRERKPKYRATYDTICHSAVPIIASASILVLASIGIHLLSSNAIISELGLLLGRGTIIATFMIFLFLPTLFAGGDWIIRQTSLRLKFFPGKDGYDAPDGADGDKDGDESLRTGPPRLAETPTAQ